MYFDTLFSASIKMFTLPDAILVPVFGHLALVFYLFVMVSIKRMKAVGEGQILTDDLAHKSNEPEASRRWANNLNNQFEVPSLFYALIGLLYATASINWIYVSLAFIFLAGRILHTWVQVSGDNVGLRGKMFTINFLAVALMWLMFFFDRWFF